MLVANASIQAFKPLLDMGDRDFPELMEVNVQGTVNALQAFATGMVARKAGRVIITASTQGRHGLKHGSDYAASKWALIGLMKSVALEWGPSGVTVNCVVPGLIGTPMTLNPTRLREAMLLVTKDVPAEPTEEQAAKVLAPGNPLGRPWMSPESIAPAVVFLASDEAALVTGATYDVTAGQSASYE